MSFASLASQHAPALPVAVSTSPALDNLASVRRTKLGLVFTLFARSAGRDAVLVTPAGQPGQEVNRNRELNVVRHNCYYNSNN